MRTIFLVFSPFFMLFCSRNHFYLIEIMIKRLHFIIGLCVLAMGVSCSPYSGTMAPRLHKADSLANDNKVDYAKTVLDAIEYNNLNEWNQHYYDLVKIKVHDIARDAHQSDSLILDVISFFENSNNYAELTAAIFYAGRVYSDLGNTPQALEYYRKAYARLDESPSTLKGRIAYQMGCIHFDLYQFYDAKNKFEEAIGFHELMNDTLELMSSYCLMGEILTELGVTDSAFTYLNKAKNMAHIYNPFGKERMEMSAQIANFHLFNNNIDAAVAELDRITPFLSADNISDYTVTAGMNVYLASNDLHRAELFAIKLSKSRSIQNVETAYATLLEISQMRNNLDDVAKYTVRYRECVDSLNSLYSQESNKLRNSLYNYTVREEKHISDVNKQNMFSLWAFILGGAVCIILIIVLTWSVYRNKKLTEESKVQLKRIEELMANDRVELNPVEDDLPPSEQLQARFLEIINNVSPKDIKVAKEVLDSEVYNKFKHCLYSEMEVKPDDRDWQLLDNVINTAYPEFKNKLYNLYPKLSEYEYYVCLLIKCKFSPSEMALLTFHSKTSIASTRSRLCLKFFCYKGVASDCDKFILSL